MTQLQQQLQTNDATLHASAVRGTDHWI